MEKQLKTEIRRLLTGRTIRDEEGWLIAVPEGNHFIYHGITDRTGYRKIKVKEKYIEITKRNESAFYLVLEALQNVGILVNLKGKPDALCALCRVFLTRRVLLCVEPEQDGKVLLQAYIGRSFTSPLCCRRLISRFERSIEELQKK